MGMNKRYILHFAVFAVLLSMTPGPVAAHHRDFSDNFNRADTVGTGTVGIGWNVSGNTANTGIVGNELRSNSAFIIHTYATSSYPYTVQVTLSQVQANAMLVFRYCSLAKWWAVRALSGQYELIQRYTGPGIQRMVPVLNQTPVAGDVLKVVDTGSSVTAYINNTAVFSYGPSPDTVCTGVGVADSAGGFANRYDDFSISDELIATATRTPVPPTPSPTRTPVATPTNLPGSGATNTPVVPTFRPSATIQATWTPGSTATPYPTFTPEPTNTPTNTPGVASPTATPIPAYVNDTFSRSSGVGWGSADSGQAWSDDDGACVGGSVSGGTGRLGGFCIGTVDSLHSDATACFNLATLQGDETLEVRATTSTSVNVLQVRNHSGHWDVMTDSSTVLWASGITAVAGDRVCLTYVGTALSLTVNGASGGSGTSSLGLTNTRVGFINYSNSWQGQVDNLLVTAPTGGSPTATPTNTAGPTATPAPTWTPGPTYTPAIQPTQPPTETPEPTGTPEPTPGSDDACYMAMRAAADLIHDGLDYCWGANSPSQRITHPLCPSGYGLDCSGLGIWAYDQAGFTIDDGTAQGLYNRYDHVSGSLMGIGMKVGDAIVIARSGPSDIFHVAWYAGGGIYADCFNTVVNCVTHRIDNINAYTHAAWVGYFRTHPLPPCGNGTAYVGTEPPTGSNTGGSGDPGPMGGGTGWVPGYEEMILNPTAGSVPFTVIETEHSLIPEENEGDSYTATIKATKYDYGCPLDVHRWGINLHVCLTYTYVSGVTILGIPLQLAVLGGGMLVMVILYIVKKR